MCRLHGGYTDPDKVDGPYKRDESDKPDKAHNQSKADKAHRPDKRDNSGIRGKADTPRPVQTKQISQPGERVVATLTRKVKQIKQLTGFSNSSDHQAL